MGSTKLNTVWHLARPVSLECMPIIAVRVYAVIVPPENLMTKGISLLHVSHVPWASIRPRRACLNVAHALSVDMPILQDKVLARSVPLVTFHSKMRLVAAYAQQGSAKKLADPFVRSAHPDGTHKLDRSFVHRVQAEHTRTEATKTVFPANLESGVGQRILVRLALLDFLRKTENSV